MHIVQEFNKGVYDYIIATDESNGSNDPESEDESSEAEEENEGGEEERKFFSNACPSKRINSKTSKSDIYSTRPRTR